MGFELISIMVQDSTLHKVTLLQVIITIIFMVDKLGIRTTRTAYMEVWKYSRMVQLVNL